MSSLKARLAKAKARFFGTAVLDVPVPFELTCECGHRVMGIRRPAFQIADCSACQTAIYVLPVNVYPGTRRVRSEEVVDGPMVSQAGTIVPPRYGIDPCIIAATPPRSPPAHLQADLRFVATASAP